jgi:hypothetical protein
MILLGKSEPHALVVEIRCRHAPSSYIFPIYKSFHWRLNQSDHHSRIRTFRRYRAAEAREDNSPKSNAPIISYLIIAVTIFERAESGAFGMTAFYGTKELDISLWKSP